MAGPKPEDFNALALTAGYETEVEMFCDLYDRKNHTLGDIGKILGFSTATIRRRMISLGLELRERGRRRSAV